MRRVAINISSHSPHATFIIPNRPISISSNSAAPLACGVMTQWALFLIARRRGASGNRLPSNSVPPRFWLATRTIADVGDAAFVPARPLFRAIDTSCRRAVVDSHLRLRASDNAPKEPYHSGEIRRRLETMPLLMIHRHRIQTSLTG